MRKQILESIYLNYTISYYSTKENRCNNGNDTGCFAVVFVHLYSDAIQDEKENTFV